MSLGESLYKSRPLILLVTSGLLFLLAFVLFWLAPDSVPISQYRVPVLSFLSALIIASMGNIVIGFIHKGVTKETEKALFPSLDALDKAVNKIRQTQFFYDEGVVGVYPNRAAAMRAFMDEIEKETQSIEFVGTSLLGTIDPHAAHRERVKFFDVLRRKSQSNVKIRALLMHPAFGELRERVEGRVSGAVANDIQKTLQFFLGCNTGSNENGSNKTQCKPLFGLSDIRLYPGVITAFAIFTSKAMLVNVSTLHGPVYPNLTLIIRDTEDENSLFKKFREEHFQEPWNDDLVIRFDLGEGEISLEKLLEIDFSDDENRFIKDGNWKSLVNHSGQDDFNKSLQSPATAPA